MKKTLFIEPHYLPSLEFFTVSSQVDVIALDVTSRFRKQTYRNRANLLGSNGVIKLSVPVRYSSQTLYKDVTIDYSQDWVRQHWGAFYSSYGKSAFFEHFEETFRRTWLSKPKYLIDLNMDMMSHCVKILGWQIDMTFEEPSSPFFDLREAISAKKSFENRNFYRPTSYFQNFGNTFVPNLSILDAIMNLGRDASDLITSSVNKPVERFSN